jgi:hypothetical protein
MPTPSEKMEMDEMTLEMSAWRIPQLAWEAGGEAAHTAALHAEMMRLMAEWGLQLIPDHFILKALRRLHAAMRDGCVGGCAGACGSKARGSCKRH